MIHKKQKPTLKRVVRMVEDLFVAVEQLRLQIYNGDLALDEYMKMKDDKQAFIKYLEEKYPKDDKDKEKTEEK
tara:strand:+ start:1305 stop:1523 length:219 start_codon:yes stop_codon:yes gene_type:complete